MKSVIVIDQKTFRILTIIIIYFLTKKHNTNNLVNLTLQEIRLHDYIIFIHVLDSIFIYFVKSLFNCSLTID